MAIDLGKECVGVSNRVLAEDADGVPSNDRLRSRVLIADGEPVTRMLVKPLLEHENFEVLEGLAGANFPGS